MEQNTDRGIWSVLILLIAVVAGVILSATLQDLMASMSDFMSPNSDLPTEETVVIPPEEEDKHWDDSLRDGSIFTYRQYGSNPGEEVKSPFIYVFLGK